MEGAWAPITAEILQSALHFACYALCAKQLVASRMNSRFSASFPSSMFLEIFFPWRDRSSGLLVAYYCLVASCTGSWGLAYKGVGKADGDVTVREGPRRQQNRCTERQTATSCCEKCLLIFFFSLLGEGVNSETQTKVYPTFVLK